VAPDLAGSLAALSVEAVPSHGRVLPDRGLLANLVDRVVYRAVAADWGDSNRQHGGGLRAFGARLLQLAGSAGLCARNALSKRRRPQSLAGLAPTGGERGVFPAGARLSTHR